MAVLGGWIAGVIMVGLLQFFARNEKQSKLCTQPQSKAMKTMQMQSSETMTIGRLAKAANVGVETIRYYQERTLLPVPTREGSYRQYPVVLVDRLRFIRRAQDLGFSLDEIGTLLTLQNGTNRKAIRAIASARIQQINAKLTDLKRMRKTLGHLLEECEHSGHDVPCPIIESIVAPNKKG